ncbi:MAG: UDP-3-O-acyl-N-acetylglucosamine deacetylase [Gammaproteobacteria bacterium]|jgi:UDP-3-O-[3-hydroxymyristoyl] N-acetylglucosamine deacetylase
MNHELETNTDPYFQHTLKDSFTCVSRGLHSGLKIVMRVTPGEANSGIVFFRRDVDATRAEIPARWTNVKDTRLSTTIANRNGVRVSTVEHLMAALYACGIDNARILLDGPEVPIMDGSAAPFVSLINRAGKVQQDEERRAIVIKQAVSVEQANKFAGFLPSPLPWMYLEIDFENQPIGRQKLDMLVYKEAFERELADARTFGFKEQVSTLHKLGLARGGSLDNAVLIQDDAIVNKEGLRYPDEFVRHKMVDAIGDISLIGMRVIGQFTGVCSGHELNNALIHKLMANEDAWGYTTIRGAQQYWQSIMQLPPANKQLAQDIMSRFKLYAG